ncbi:MAG: 2-C-methyl-D-erythritol 4-phosphate cytidylyltransferase [Dehalococcoidia bacterium]
MQADAIIVAAGSSTRFGGDKLLVELAGRPVLAWTLAAYEAAGNVGRIIVVTAEERRATVEALGQQWAPRKFAGTVPGGARRRDSVEAGLRASKSRYVAVADGARPLTTPDAIDRCIAAAQGHPGAILAIPVTDTIKEVADGRITGHPDRARLWAAQTPQVVLRQAWLEAAAASDGDETDDAAMLSRLGLECRVVEGSPENLKVTRPLDLVLAERILATRT